MTAEAYLRYQARRIGLSLSKSRLDGTYMLIESDGYGHASSEKLPVYWKNPTGYGLTLDDIARAIAGDTTYQGPNLDAHEKDERGWPYVEVISAHKYWDTGLGSSPAHWAYTGKVRCPYCTKLHTHGLYDNGDSDQGSRVPHCARHVSGQYHLILTAPIDEIPED